MASLVVINHWQCIRQTCCLSDSNWIKYSESFVVKVTWRTGKQLHVEFSVVAVSSGRNKVWSNNRAETFIFSVVFRSQKECFVPFAVNNIYSSKWIFKNFASWRTEVSWQKTSLHKKYKSDTRGHKSSVTWKRFQSGTYLATFSHEKILY